MWRDPERWSALRDGSACPICADGKPGDTVAEFPASWVTAPERAALPGYVCVVSKRHVVEPFELPRRERARFWEDVTVVAKSISELLSPVKVNYELHGNTIPHLHVHIYPRFPGDPFEDRPVGPRDGRFLRSREDLDAIRRVLVNASAGSGLPARRAQPS